MIARTLFCLYFIICWLFLGISHVPNMDFFYCDFDLKVDVLIFTHIRCIMTKPIKIKLIRNFLYHKGNSSNTVLEHCKVVRKEIMIKLGKERDTLRKSQVRVIEVQRVPNTSTVR